MWDKYSKGGVLEKIFLHLPWSSYMVFFVKVSENSPSKNNIQLMNSELRFNFERNFHQQAHVL